MCSVHTLSYIEYSGAIRQIQLPQNRLNDDDLNNKCSIPLMEVGILWMAEICTKDVWFLIESLIQS